MTIDDIMALHCEASAACSEVRLTECAGSEHGLARVCETALEGTICQNSVDH